MCCAYDGVVKQKENKKVIKLTYNTRALVEDVCTYVLAQFTHHWYVYICLKFFIIKKRLQKVYVKKELKAREKCSEIEETQKDKQSQEKAEKIVLIETQDRLQQKM